MSGTQFRFLRHGLWAAGSLLLGLALAGRAAEPRDKDGDPLLDRARRLNDVAAQKVLADVRAGLLEAQRITLKDPAQAVERLKKVLTGLEDDSTLPQARRDSLVRMVKDRIRVAEAGPDRSADDGGKRLEVAGRRAKAEADAAERDKVKRSLETIKELRKEGRTEEANRQADELARRHPDNPAAQASRRINAVAEQVAANRDLNAERGRAAAAVSRDVTRAGMPPKDDIEFPKDWAKRTKDRAATKLTAKEKAILRALATPVPVDFKESRFEDVVEYLATVMNQPIVVDKEAMKEAGLTYDSPITLRVNKPVAARTILRKVLGEFGLAYVIKEEAIQVTSALKAKEMMVTRAYYLGDLLGGEAGLGPLGPAAGALQRAQNALAIIDIIQSTVDPESWKENGGSGTIVYNAATRSLVIKQSAEVHGLLSGMGGQ
jgi:hypothetical protein